MEHPWLRVGDALRFVEALGDLDREGWLNAAARARQCEGSRRVAGDRLGAIVRQDGASFPAWWLNDDIDTLAWYCLWASPRRHTSGFTRLIDEAIDAARVAALAVLLRARLGEQRFRVLYEPFASVIPPADRCRPADRTPPRLYGIFVRDGSGSSQRSRVASHTQP